MSFPVRLHRALTEVDREGLNHNIVSWQPHGRSFMVHDPDQFVQVVLSRFCKQTKFSSFQRQCNLYGFKKIFHGRDRGSYYHELFLRDKPMLATKIRLVKKKLGQQQQGPPNHKAVISPELEPDFYSMPPVVPPATGMGGSDVQVATRVATDMASQQLTTRVPAGMGNEQLATRVATGMGIQHLATRVPAGMGNEQLTTRVVTGMGGQQLATRVSTWMGSEQLATRAPTGMGSEHLATRVPVAQVSVARRPNGSSYDSSRSSLQSTTPSLLSTDVLQSLLGRISTLTTSAAPSIPMPARTLPAAGPPYVLSVASSQNYPWMMPSPSSLSMGGNSTRMRRLSNDIVPSAGSTTTGMWIPMRTTLALDHQPQDAGSNNMSPIAAAFSSSSSSRNMERILWQRRRAFNNMHEFLLHSGAIGGGGGAAASLTNNSGGRAGMDPQVVEEVMRRLNSYQHDGPSTCPYGSSSTNDTRRMS